MIKMRRTLQAEFPSIAFYGCAAHAAAKIGEKTTNSTIQKQVAQVQKFFKNHHVLSVSVMIAHFCKFKNQ
jgi:hypothetical protein